MRITYTIQYNTIYLGIMMMRYTNQMHKAHFHVNTNILPAFNDSTILLMVFIQEILLVHFDLFLLVHDFVCIWHRIEFNID